MGQLPTSLPLSPSQGVSSSEQVHALAAPSPPTPEPLPRWQHPFPELVDVSPPGGPTPQVDLMGPLAPNNER